TSRMRRCSRNTISPNWRRSTIASRRRRSSTSRLVIIGNVTAAFLCSRPESSNFLAPPIPLLSRDRSSRVRSRVRSGSNRGRERLFSQREHLHSVRDGTGGRDSGHHKNAAARVAFRAGKPAQVSRFSPELELLHHEKHEGGSPPAAIERDAATALCFSGARR